MDFNYTLKYRSFDSLLEDVKLDLRSLAQDTSIEPAQLIKVARRVNYDLGLRIEKTKEKVLEICKGKAQLPEDFHVMNFALLCGTYSYVEIPPQGTHIEQYAPEYTPWVETNLCGESTSESTCLTQCGTGYKLIQVVKGTTREYSTFAPIVFRNSNMLSTECPNRKWYATDEAYIKDGWLYTSFDEGNVYINYQGDMIDDDNNLLVLDHPMINEYYEYALKKRILENLILDNVNVAPQLQLIAEEYRIARKNANTIVNTPNFSELQKVWAANRKAMYGRYYDMFKSYYYPTNFRTNNVL